jgi:DNA repair exonuclease SbcCD ATPase subunit
MINYLKMINWRAYEEKEINFQKGITFLMGANGSGKTSILEAISYALTGEAALFKGGERSQLLRDPKKPGVVTLKFEVGDFEYEIQRIQKPERAGDAQIVRVSDRKFLASNQGAVTNQVEKLLGISEDFLRRVVYMAEGDVFNFLNKPPKDALDDQIRSVLGLTQLNEFKDALYTSEKYFKNQLKTLQDLNSDLARLQVKSLVELEGKLSGGQKARDEFLNQLDNIGREFGSLDQNANTIRNFQKEIDNVKSAVALSPNRWSDIANSPILDYFDRLQNQAHEAESHQSEIMLFVARLDGQEEAYNQIIALLEPFEGSENTVPCPVCRKPLTNSERKDILTEIRQNVERLKNDRAVQNQNKEKATQDIQIIKNQIEQLQPLRSLLTQIELPGIHPSHSFEKISTTLLNLSQDQQGGKIAELTQQRETLKQRLKELESYNAEYQAVKKRLLEFNFNSPEDLGDEIIRVETRMLSIRAASQATEETLQSQQSTDMKVIYEQIANLWSSFREDEGWEMQYNSDGYPVMTKNDEQLTLDLRQLSGGEKTALLIMLHTIIAHHFSKSDFLMIDEPLEHLDPVNRRSLIRFLVDAYKHDIFGQAIIATFEESLIRKYQSDKGVNVILV